MQIVFWFSWYPELDAVHGQVTGILKNQIQEWGHALNARENVKDIIPSI